MAVIGFDAENSNDEVIQYQMGRYVSSNEAIWRIFSFSIHDVLFSHGCLFSRVFRKCVFYSIECSTESSPATIYYNNHFFRDVPHNFQDEIISHKHCYILKCQNIILEINQQKNLCEGDKKTQFKIIQMYIQPMQ
jgi:hypothetical protein